MRHEHAMESSLPINVDWRILAGNGAALQTFDAKTARVLLGMRHTGGGNPFFAGEIEEARLYNHALAANEIKASFESGPGLVSPATIAAKSPRLPSHERSPFLSAILLASST